MLRQRLLNEVFSQRTIFLLALISISSLVPSQCASLRNRDEEHVVALDGGWATYLPTWRRKRGSAPRRLETLSGSSRTWTGPTWAMLDPDLESGPSLLSRWVTRQR